MREGRKGYVFCLAPLVPAAGMLPVTPLLPVGVEARWPGPRLDVRLGWNDPAATHSGVGPLTLSCGPLCEMGT